MIETDKKILDACCGGRMFWFDKANSDTLYIDIKPRPKGSVDDRNNWECKPDIVADFRELPFPDETFYHIVWDPPHAKQLSERGRIPTKYGILHPETWQHDLGKGFLELWRVLKVNGTLIFKWNEKHVTIKQVLKLFPVSPLYGHTTAKSGKTKWMAFVKTKQSVGKSDNNLQDKEETK